MFLIKKNVCNIYIYSIKVHLQESYMFICFICINFRFLGKFQSIVFTLLGQDQELKKCVFWNALKQK